MLQRMHCGGCGPRARAWKVYYVLAVFAYIKLQATQQLNYPEANGSIDLDELNRKPQNDELRLLRYLLRTYDKSVRPVFNASHSVTIKVGITLTHIFNIDEKSQVLSVNVWLEHEWLDERIRWNPSDFGGLGVLTISTKFVWIPDVVLFNNADDFAIQLLQTNVALYPRGTILWAPPAKFRSTCKLDLTFFPYDQQICYLRFGSWIYDGTQVDVTNRSESISLDSYTDNGEWEIVRTAVHRNIYYYPCCKDQPFPIVTFTLHLKRRTLFYMYNIIIPCIMLSMLTLLQFWLPSESGEKITLGLTVLLAYSVFSFNIGENMPETSDVIPLIAIYIMCIMGISSLSVLLSVIVLNLRHTAEELISVPPWLRYLTYNLIGPCVCWPKAKSRQWLDQQERLESAFNTVNTLSSYIAQRTASLPFAATLLKSPEIQELSAERLMSAEAGIPIKLDEQIQNVSSEGRMREPVVAEVGQTEAKQKKKEPTSIAANVKNLAVDEISSSSADTNALSIVTLDSKNGELTEALLAQPLSPIEASQSATESQPRHQSVPEEQANEPKLQEPPMTVSHQGAGGGVVQQSADQVRRRKAVEQVVSKTALLLEKFELEKRCARSVHEWRKVATIFDQLFFWIAFTLTFGCMFGMLVLAPAFSRMKVDQIFDNRFYMP